MFSLWAIIIVIQYLDYCNPFLSTQNCGVWTTQVCFRLLISLKVQSYCITLCSSLAWEDVCISGMLLQIVFINDAIQSFHRVDLTMSIITSTQITELSGRVANVYCAFFLWTRTSQSCTGLIQTCTTLPPLELIRHLQQLKLCLWFQKDYGCCWPFFSLLLSL